jgi:hypothetical protein
MMLPEGIELLKQRQKKNHESETVQTSTLHPAKLDDVEYYEDYEETVEKSTENTRKSFEQSNRKTEPLPLRPYSIDLWNGSPILPNFEDFKFENSS